jgi:hypothetical protein
MLRNAAQVAPASGIPMIDPLCRAARRRGADAGADRARWLSGFEPDRETMTLADAAPTGRGGALMLRSPRSASGFCSSAFPWPSRSGLPGCWASGCRAFPVGGRPRGSSPAWTASSSSPCPFYILAAEIMAQGGITARLIAIGSALTSWLRGGTALPTSAPRSCSPASRARRSRTPPRSGGCSSRRCRRRATPANTPRRSRRPRPSWGRSSRPRASPS